MHDGDMFQFERYPKHTVTSTVECFIVKKLKCFGTSFKVHTVIRSEAVAGHKNCCSPTVSIKCDLSSFPRRKLKNSKIFFCKDDRDSCDVSRTNLLNNYANNKCLILFLKLCVTIKIPLQLFEILK